MTRCTVCTYDLSGLDEHGRCPECGTSIAEQTRAVPITEVPTMLALLARRLPRVRRSVVIAPVSIILAIAIEAWWIARAISTTDPVTDLSPIAAIPLLLGGFYTAWAWIGVAPRALGGTRISRLYLRHLAALIPISAGTVVVASAILKSIGSPAFLALLPPVLLALSLAIVAATHTLGLLHLRWVAERTKARGLGRRLRRAAVGPALTIGGWVAGVFLTPLTILIDPITGLVPALWIASITVLVPVLMTVWLFESRAATADLTRRLADLAARQGYSRSP